MFIHCFFINNLNFEFIYSFFLHLPVLQLSFEFFFDKYEPIECIIDPVNHNPYATLLLFQLLEEPVVDRGRIWRSLQLQINIVVDVFVWVSLEEFLNKFLVFSATALRFLVKSFKFVMYERFQWINLFFFNNMLSLWGILGRIKIKRRYVVRKNTLSLWRKLRLVIIKIQNCL